MDTSRWTRENLAWLAGLLEGEGCFFAMKRKHATALRVACNMTDGDVMARLAAVAGAGHLCGPFVTGVAHHKPFWRWQVGRRNDVYALIVALYPWMGERRQARIRECIAAYAERARAPWRHGTRQGYERGCRCDPCKGAHAARMRERRARGHRAPSELARRRTCSSTTILAHSK